MDEHSKIGGARNSDTDSTNSPTLKPVTSSEFRMLTSFELELLLLKQIEIAERHRQLRAAAAPIADSPEAAE